MDAEIRKVNIKITLFDGDNIFGKQLDLGLSLSDIEVLATERINLGTLRFIVETILDAMIYLCRVATVKDNKKTGE